MNGQRLARGMKILWNNFEYLIEERLSNGQIRLLNKHTEERRIVEEILLIEAQVAGNLKILGHNNESRNLEQRIEKNHVSDFTALDDNDPRKIKALKKHAYLKELLSNKKSGFSNEEISEIIKKVSAMINDSSPPCVETVRRWKNTYVESGEDIRSLIDANKSKGNRCSKFSPETEINVEVLNIINASVNEVFLTPQKQPVQAVIDLVEYRINKTNETRSENNKLPVPHPSSIYRIVSQLDEYEVDKAREGERFANAKHKTLNKAVQQTRPLERVECDDTPTNLMVIERETRLPLGRPWIMMLIDVYTKMILGYFLSFSPPSHETVMMAMKHAIKPKTYIPEKYPDIVNSWDAYGLIEVLVIDNAKHWYGEGIEDACYQLGTDMQFNPVRIPWFKGSIERLLRTIHQSLIHKMPGTTFSDIFEKGDYDPKKHAVIYLDLLDELIHKWIVDVYSQSIHKGINDIPARKWKEGIVRHPPALPPAHTKLEILLGKVVYRTISGTVIRLKNLEYSDSILSTIKTDGKNGRTVKIKYDPTDLGMIYVYDAFWCRFVPVPAVDQEYAKGLTEFQHEVICKFIRRRNEALVDRKSLVEAKEYIRRRIAAELESRPKNLRSSIKITRWGAFDDPSEVRIIHGSQHGTDSSNNESGNGQLSENQRKLLKPKTQFIPPAEQSNKPLQWNEDENWNAHYSDSDKEDL